MKTAEEWIATFADTDLAKTYFDLTAADIRAVQADALRHAARICLSNHNAYNSDADCEMLQAEADKLEGK